MGSAFCDWVPPFVIGLHPLSLGSSLRHCASPFVVGSDPSSLGPTLRCWAQPFVVGPYHSLLGLTLRRCVLRPSPFGFTLRCWVLPPEGSGCDHLRVVQLESGGFEHPRVVQHEGGGSTCWPACHRRHVIGEGPPLSSLGPTHCPRVVGRRSSFGLRSPLVPLVVAAPHAHGCWVFVLFAGRCCFSGWAAESLSWFITPVVCGMA